jgi:hypothetical protein
LSAKQVLNEFGNTSEMIHGRIRAVGPLGPHSMDIIETQPLSILKETSALNCYKLIQEWGWALLSEDNRKTRRLVTREYHKVLCKEGNNESPQGAERGAKTSLSRLRGYRGDALNGFFAVGVQVE